MVEKQMPLVTVIVAVYNIENYIRRCVDSLLAQTYSGLEILLVDDGSTDGSGLICDTYATSDERIRVIHKKNGGLSDARNAGLDEAHGDYIGYVDGDDWIEPDMYENLVNACLKLDSPIAVCRYSQFLEILDKEAGVHSAENKSGEIPGMRYTKQPDGEAPCTGEMVVMDTDEALRHFIKAETKYKIHNCVWSKLFSKEIAGRYRFPVGRNSEDIIYTTKTFCDCRRIAYVDKQLYNYVVGRSGSIMNVGLFDRRLQHEIPFFREQIAYLKEKGKEDLSDLAAFYFYRRIMFYYREACDVGRQKGNGKDGKHYATLLAKELLDDKNVIRAITKKDWAPKGDCMRMRLFVASPAAYRMVCDFYEKLVVPVKRKIRGIA